MQTTFHTCIDVLLFLLCCQDLAKEAAPHYKKARKFYEQLGAQLVHQAHSLDVFACSLDQVGAVHHIPRGRQGDMTSIPVARGYDIYSCGRRGFSQSSLWSL
jgi:hypothetical protein